MVYSILEFETGDSMSKIKVKITLTTPEELYDYIVSAIYQPEESIVYKEQGEENTKVKFDFKTNVLIRENNTMLLMYEFNKKQEKATIIIKDMNKKLNLELKTINILRCSKTLEITYLLEGQKYNYKIEVI